MILVPEPHSMRKKSAGCYQVIYQRPNRVLGDTRGGKPRTYGQSLIRTCHAAGYGLALTKPDPIPREYANNAIKVRHRAIDTSSTNTFPKELVFGFRNLL